MTLQLSNHIENMKANRLSVQISLSGLSFLVQDENRSPLLFKEKLLEHSTTPEEILLEVETLFSEHDLWSMEFSEVSVVYTTPIYSLVPAELFDETKASEYLKFNSKILANDYVAYDQIDALGIVVVYVPLMNVNNYFFEKYGSFNYYHSATILLKTILKNKNYSLPRIYLHFQQNSFDCLIIKDGELQLCNTYSFNSPEDFMYYTLFSMEQLKLDPETVSVYLCGDIEKDDANYEIAYNYIRNLEFVDTENTLTAIAPEMANHQHFIIRNID